MARRGNARFKGQEEETARWREDNKERRGNEWSIIREGRRGLCVAFMLGTWDTLHMSTSVPERSPHSKSNVNLISSGLKEANNNPHYSSSFYDHQQRQDAEMKTLESCKPFRRRCCSTS